jgi:hypothetical protein
MDCYCHLVYGFAALTRQGQCRPQQQVSVNIAGIVRYDLA